MNPPRGNSLAKRNAERESVLASVLAKHEKQREEEHAKETHRGSRKTQRQAARHRIPRRAITQFLGVTIAREKLDYIENLITIYRRQVKGIRKLPKARERKRQLMLFGSALDTILENNQIAKSYFQGTEEFARLKSAAKSLQPIVRCSLKQKLRKGRDRDERTPVILELARIFESQTGQPATISWKPYSDRFESLFFSFARLCFTPLDPFPSDNALGAAIRDALKTRKVETK